MSDDRFLKLTRLSQTMRWVVIATMAALFLGTAWGAVQWIQAPASMIERLDVSNLDAATLTPLRHWLVVLAWAVVVVLGLRALMMLENLFSAFARREVLSDYTTGLIRSAGAAFLIAAVAIVVVRTSTILLISWGNPPGQRMLAIGVGTNEAFLVLMAGTLFVIGQVLNLAVAIDEENKGFV